MVWTHVSAWLCHAGEQGRVLLVGSPSTWLVTAQMSDPYGIHMHGQRCPEWVNVGHGQVVVVRQHKGFDVALSWFSAGAAGSRQAMAFLKHEICGMTTKCVLRV